MYGAGLRKAERSERSIFSSAESGAGLFAARAASAAGCFCPSAGAAAPTRSASGASGLGLASLEPCAHAAAAANRSSAGASSAGRMRVHDLSILIPLRLVLPLRPPPPNAPSAPNAFGRGSANVLVGCGFAGAPRNGGAPLLAARFCDLAIRIPRPGVFAHARADVRTRRS
jgi:hypothetical protein